MTATLCSMCISFAVSGVADIFMPKSPLKFKCVCSHAIGVSIAALDIISHLQLCKLLVLVHAPGLLSKA